MRTEGAGVEPDAVHDTDGFWLIAGSMPVDEFAECLSFPISYHRACNTVAGLVLDQLAYSPQVGKTTEVNG
jgi:putative hemolysin